MRIPCVRRVGVDGVTGDSPRRAALRLAVNLLGAEEGEGEGGIEPACDMAGDRQRAQKLTRRRAREKFGDRRNAARPSQQHENTPLA